MNKKFDIVVIGAGLSSLMFLSRYIHNNKNQSILLIEKNKKRNINQTFCIWQGPDLIDIKKLYNLRARHVWNKIRVSYGDENVDKDIAPYSYECFDGNETLTNLLNQCKGKITFRRGLDVKKIKNHKDSVEIITSKGSIKTKYVIDSRNKISKKQYAYAPNLHQAFIGNEIIVEKEKFNPDLLTLMKFSRNKKDIEFTYILPFSKKKALVETTLFAKNPSLNNIQKIHNQSLIKHSKFRSIKKESGILPMILGRNYIDNNIIPIGLSAGMARPSTGYSMMRIAQWINSIENHKIESDNIKRFEFRPNKLLEWFDSIFLTVCYFWPQKAPILFMRLFSNADIKSIIRFMSDAPTIRDIIFIILSMPKKLMIHGLIKKYVK
ncbi:MAG: lycopene cyclase family protein [Methylophilaceae bacterium]|nr:lycopene cyclase family protein [Methylophilaceae bacterium]